MLIAEKRGEFNLEPTLECVFFMEEFRIPNFKFQSATWNFKLGTWNFKPSWAVTTFRSGFSL